MPEAKVKQEDEQTWSWDRDSTLLEKYEEGDPLAWKGAVRVWNDFMQWSGSASASFEKIIDMGCGPGTITEALVKWKDIKNEGKPEEIRNGAHKDKGSQNKEIVGTDISESAITLCKEKKAKILHDVFGDPVKMSYHVADSGDPTGAFLKNKENMGKFDLVTSFMALHWVPDQKKALQCVYSCLKPGGSFVLSIYLRDKLERAETSDGLKSNPKWHPFIKDINPDLEAWQNLIERELIPSDWSSSHIADAYVKLACEVGLEIDCKIITERFFYDQNYLRTLLLLFCPYFNAVPEEMKKDLLNDLVAETYRTNPPIMHEGKMCMEAEAEIILVYGVKKL